MHGVMALVENEMDKYDNDVMSSTCVESSFCFMSAVFFAFPTFLPLGIVPSPCTAAICRLRFSVSLISTRQVDIRPLAMVKEASTTASLTEYEVTVDSPISMSVTDTSGEDVWKPSEGIREV